MGVSFAQEVTVVLWFQIHSGAPMDIGYEFTLVPEDEENRQIIKKGIEDILFRFVGPANDNTLYYARYHIEGMFRFLSQEPRFNKTNATVRYKQEVSLMNLPRRDGHLKFDIKWSWSKEAKMLAKKAKRMSRAEAKARRRQRSGKHPGYTILKWWDKPGPSINQYAHLFYEKTPDIGPDTALNKSLERIRAHDEYYSNNKLTEEQREELWKKFNPPEKPYPKLRERQLGETADVIVIDEAHRVRKEP